MAENIPVNAVRISLELVDLLWELNGAGISEVAKRLDKPTNTIHNHLWTLERQECFVKESDAYYVGTRFLQLGAHTRSRQKVLDVARPKVDELAQMTGEHANLMIEEHSIGVFLYHSQGPDAVRLDTHAGMCVPLQTTAFGKSVMVNRPRGGVKGILDRHGLGAVADRSITDREELFDMLGQIREHGYSYDNEEQVKGMRYVATPILNEGDYAITAVSVSGPRNRIHGERFTEELPDQILESASVIEVNLTCSQSASRRLRAARLAPVVAMLHKTQQLRTTV